MSDPFEDFADEHQSRYSKRRESKAAERAREKEKHEREYLFREWQAWHTKRKTELLAGPWSAPAQELAAFLERMTLEDADALLTLIEQGPWPDTDEDTRFLVQELISHSIIYLRECAGLPPFDDAMPFTDEELNASLRIREYLR
jgi:hypothetical protein